MLRLLGVAIPDVSDWSDPQPRGKWSRFFTALADRAEVVGIVRPSLSRAEVYWNMARSFHPQKARWRARMGFNHWSADRRTQDVEHGLRRYEGTYDVIMQLQTLCAPGRGQADTPYVIYTDNTMALTRRVYPEAVPLGPSAARDWMSFEADVCRSAAAVFTFSEFARGSVIEDYGCPVDRVQAVGAGANQLVEDFERSPDRPRALFAGMDFPRKGGHVLLDAWPAVRQRVPEAELVIAGPSHEPGSELGPGVRWVGRVAPDELAQLYREASVFVMPSLFEPWGHVFLEAMGHGLPCIGTSCCAIPEIIQDGVTGRLVPRFQPDDLADAMIELLANPSRAAAMGRAAHQHVLHGNRWSDVALRVIQHLDATLGGGSAVP